MPPDSTLCTSFLCLCRRPVREIERLRKKEHKWQDLVLKPGEKPLEGITGDLLEIQAQIEPRNAEEVGLTIRGIDVVYDTERQQLRCLGETAPLKMTDGSIKPHLLVERTSLELFGNDGLLSISSCILLDQDNKSLAFFCRAATAKLHSLIVWPLKSIWNNRSAPTL